MTGEFWADFADLVAEGDHVVEAVPGELVEVFAAPSGQVDAVRAHDPRRVRVQRFGVAARAGHLDLPTGRVRQEGFGDLGPGAVAGTEKQHPHRRYLMVLGNRGCRTAQTGVQRSAGGSKQLPAASQIYAVVAVPPIGRTAPHGDQPAVT